MQLMLFSALRETQTQTQAQSNGVKTAEEEYNNII